MPVDFRWLNSNVLPNAFRNVDSIAPPRAFRDLVSLGSGYDFLLQASNRMCAEAAFNSLDLLYVKHPLDAQAVSTLRASGVSFSSTALERAVAAAVGASEAMEVLLVFRSHDVLFESADRCRIRLGVRVALGKAFSMPKEPGLGRRLEPGEAIQQFLNPRVGNPAGPLSPAMFVGEAPTVRPPAMRPLSGPLPTGMGVFSESEFDLARLIELDAHLDLGDRTSFDVVAWVGGGVLEVPAPFAATADPASKTIRVSADLHDSSPAFTELSRDAALLLSPSDPMGFLQSLTFNLRRRGSAKLINDVSLLGAAATANAGHLGPLLADTFPTRVGACSLNVAATIVAGRTTARSTNEFIDDARYGVVWSAEAVRLLVRYCWETHLFPRAIKQSQMLKVTVDGIEQMAEAISFFQLEELTDIELEFDANGRRDVLYTNGSARVVPALVRLQNGTELYPKDPEDPVFAPSKRMRWSAFGELTEEALVAAAPDLLEFCRGVTRGVTSRLGRPFTDPPPEVMVNYSRLSAVAQRVALLVK